jgi:hypothetical protein
MRTLATTALFAATIAVAGIAATPAEAACTRLGFSVNDYGKDGPIRDAKGLLDKYIARWASERGIKSYRTGPKAVNCELFLDLIVFDEHTCRAEATVCWDGPPVAPAVKADGEPGVTTSPEKKAPAKKDPAATSNVKRAAAPVTPAPRAAKPATETVVPVAATPPAKPDAAAIYIAPAAKPATAATAPAAAPAAPRVETGTIPADRAPAAAAAPKAAESGDAALLAAQRAAAAAERAAAAAERAAAAAAAAEKASGRQ